MIRRGEAWGELVPPPPDLIDVQTDAEAAFDRDDVRLRGGDLLATLGGPTTGPLVARFPVDVLIVHADDEELSAMAHVVARGRTWWRGPILGVCNVDHVGRWDVAPRAHPGDGRFDVIEVAGSMSLRARWQGWRRLPTGTHVPHPAVTVRQATSASWTFDAPRRLWIDGVERGLVVHLEVTIEPQARVVYT